MNKIVVSLLAVSVLGDLACSTKTGKTAGISSVFEPSSTDVDTLYSSMNAVANNAATSYKVSLINVNLYKSKFSELMSSSTRASLSKTAWPTWKSWIKPSVMLED